MRGYRIAGLHRRTYFADQLIDGVLPFLVRGIVFGGLDDLKTVFPLGILR
jgi:hypothetical protein